MYVLLIEILNIFFVVIIRKDINYLLLSENEGYKIVCIVRVYFFVGKI